MAANKKANGSNGNRGKRYTTAFKSKVVKYVSDYNSKHGRGGQSQAAKKFELSQLTVASWLRSPNLTMSVEMTKGKNGTVVGDSLKQKIHNLLKVSDELRKLDAEATRLRKKHDDIRESILRDL